MKLIICKDEFEVGKVCGDLFIDLINRKPNANIGLATGSTPLTTYKYLIDAYTNNRVSFKDVKSFNLDEYVGIERTNPQSYYYFMHEFLFDHIDIKKENIYVPFAYKNKEESTKEYTKLINANPIDLQLLGIGRNGHIGFNEPNTPFSKNTWIVKLDERTKLDNQRFFNSFEEVPEYAITMGINDILKAKRIVLIATGKNKSEAIKRLMEKEVSEDFPASSLNLHNDVLIIVDQAAASLL